MLYPNYISFLLLSEKSAILIPPWVSFEDVILFFSMGSHLWYFRLYLALIGSFPCSPSFGGVVVVMYIYTYIYICICFYSFADSFEFRNSNLSGCVYLLFDLPSWCWAFIYFIPMPQGLWKSLLELSKSLILASNWVSAGFTHFSGLMFAAGFWPLCSCFFPGQWYIYMFSMP